MIRVIQLLFCLIAVFAHGIAIAETSATAYLMTTSVSSAGNVSTLHFINDEYSQPITGTLYAGNGEMLGEADTPLHDGWVFPMARVLLTSSDLERIFNVPPWSGPAMLEVKGQQDFKLMIKLESPSGFISNSNCVTEKEVHNLEGEGSANPSYIRFINTTSEETAPIFGNLYDSTGTRIGPSAVYIGSLNPKEQAWVSTDNLISAYGTWSGTATLRVSNTVGLKLLNLSFVNAETFFNFSCFETTSSSSSSNIVFPLDTALEGTIDGEFEGWEGDTIFELTNGQVWKQDSYVYEYQYKYLPWVVIYPVTGGRYKAVVEGSDKKPYVIRLQ